MLNQWLTTEYNTKFKPLSQSLCFSFLFTIPTISAAAAAAVRSLYKDIYVLTFLDLIRYEQKVGVV
jgi:hypothetical protein